MPPFLIHSQCQTVEKYPLLQIHLPRAKFDIVLKYASKELTIGDIVRASESKASDDEAGDDEASDDDASDDEASAHEQSGSGDPDYSVAVLCDNTQIIEVDSEVVLSNKTSENLPERPLGKCYSCMLCNHLFAGVQVAIKGLIFAELCGHAVSRIIVGVYSYNYADTFSINFIAVLVNLQEVLTLSGQY